MTVRLDCEHLTPEQRAAATKAALRLRLHSLNLAIKKEKNMTHEFNRIDVTHDDHLDGEHPVTAARRKRDAYVANAHRHVDPPVGGAPASPVQRDHVDADDEHPVARARRQNEERMANAFKAGGQ